MNQQEKVRTAIQKFDETACNLEKAIEASKVAEKEATNAKNDLAKVIHAVYGGKPIIHKGKKYRSISNNRNELSLTVEECDTVILD